MSARSKRPRLTWALAGSCVLMCVFWTLRRDDPEPTDEQWVAIVLFGQLGNQLWEMASAYGIARARRARWCVVDGEWRGYMRGLDWIAEPPETCPDPSIIGIPLLPRTWTPRSFASVSFGGFAEYSEQYALSPQPRISLDSTLQSFKYFDKALPIPFRLKATQRARAWVEAGGYTTAIHVRRGDKLWDVGNVVPPLDYFKQALGQLEALFPGPHRVVVATDDPGWVQAQPLFLRAHLLQSDDVFFDMAVISQCRHKIISIGTFGWWGAFLTDTGSNRSNAVIYAVPQMDGSLADSMVYGDYFPAHWTALAWAR